MTHYAPQIKIPATYMRGGTSKGVFFRLQDLPARPRERPSQSTRDQHRYRHKLPLRDCDVEGFAQRHAFPPLGSCNVLSFGGFVIFCPKKTALLLGDGLRNGAAFVVDFGVNAVRRYGDDCARRIATDGIPQQTRLFANQHRPAFTLIELASDPRSTAPVLVLLQAKIIFHVTFRLSSRQTGKVVDCPTFEFGQFF